MIFRNICLDIRGLTNVTQLEQLNKRYWYVCQDYTEYKYPHQPKRFPEIMMCLPEIRCIAGKSKSQRDDVFFIYFHKICKGINLAVKNSAVLHSYFREVGQHPFGAAPPAV